MYDVLIVLSMAMLVIASLASGVGALQLLACLFATASIWVLVFWALMRG